MKSDSAVFNEYATVYDNLYEAKDYEAECDFLEEIFTSFSENKVKAILDLGCGTGGHALPLARRGYHITGVDLSPSMIDLAKQKVKDEELQNNLHFEVGNIQTLELGETFDAVVCMFAVLGYQTTNEGLIATLNTVRSHLKPGGVFISDFWYGPAVFKERPSERVKIIHLDGQRIVRLAKPLLDTEANTVEVSYNIFVLKGDKLIEEIHENHKMRFLFLPELELALSQVGLQLEHSCAFQELDLPVGEETWNVAAIAKAL